ncbi:hypothetical protein ABK040_009059 [Willaertia magna]
MSRVVPLGNRLNQQHSYEDSVMFQQFGMEASMRSIANLNTLMRKPINNQNNNNNNQNNNNQYKIRNNNHLKSINSLNTLNYSYVSGKKDKTMERKANLFERYLFDKISGISRRYTILVFLILILIILVTVLIIVNYFVVSNFVSRALTLEQASGYILLYDEVLTMSALMTATNGSTFWRDRYYYYATFLDGNISLAISVMPSYKVDEVTKQLQNANLALVSMEEMVLNLGVQGNSTEALRIIHSGEYDRNKTEYKLGVDIITGYVQSYESYIKMVQLVCNLVILVVTLFFLPIFLVYLGLSYKVEQRMKTEIVEEKHRSDQFLQSILPKNTIELIQKGATFVANRHNCLTVYFLDIVSFTSIAGRHDATQIVTMLNTIFSTFDLFAQKQNVEKIKTIGDCYMCVTGLDDDLYHAHQMLNFALDTMDYMSALDVNVLGGSTEKIQCRIGIHSGTAVSGVIGATKFSFDVWGDTVNVASRMESCGYPMKINVSESTYSLTKNDYEYEERREVAVKGKGVMGAYFLAGKKIAALVFDNIN